MINHWTDIFLETVSHYIFEEASVTLESPFNSELNGFVVLKKMDPPKILVLDQKCILIPLCILKF